MFMLFSHEPALGDIISTYPVDSSPQLAQDVFYELRRLGFDLCLHQSGDYFIIYGDGEDGDLETAAVDVEWFILRNRK